MDAISKRVELSSREVTLLNSLFKKASYSKGTTVEAEQKIAQHLYFITEGFVRTFCMEDGAEITTHIVGKNAFTTSFRSFVSGIKSNETIQCISDCEVLYIAKSDYELLRKESAAWSQFCNRIYEETIASQQQRTRDLIALNPEKRYVKIMTEQPEVIQHVPIQYIASYIGIQPESLSRIRKRIVS